MSDLPVLLDCKAICGELGVTRAVAEALMRRCPKQKVPGIRKTFVRRSDLQRVLDENRVAA